MVFAWETLRGGRYPNGRAYAPGTLLTYRGRVVVARGIEEARLCDTANVRIVMLSQVPDNAMWLEDFVRENEGRLRLAAGGIDPRRLTGGKQ